MKGMGKRVKNKTLKDIVMEKDFIWSLMYSPNKSKLLSLEEQILEIKTKELIWAKDEQSFFWIWGYPGPDFNTYDISTYGKGWAFDRETILNSWKDEK